MKKLVIELNKKQPTLRAIPYRSLFVYEGELYVKGRREIFNALTGKTLRINGDTKVNTLKSMES